MTHPVNKYQRLCCTQHEFYCHEFFCEGNSPEHCRLKHMVCTLQYLKRVGLEVGRRVKKYRNVLMMSKLVSKRLSLAEQIAQLADPRPSNFHPDEDERDQLGAVNLNYAREDSEEEDSDHVQQRSSLRVSWEDDPRYAGRPITRKELELDDQDKEEYSIAAAGRHCIYAVTF